MKNSAFVTSLLMVSIICYIRAVDALLPSANLTAAKALVLDDSNSPFQGIYLPTSYSHNDRPVYINEEYDRFMARNLYSWCIGHLRYIESALFSLTPGQSFGVFLCNDFQDSQTQGWPASFAVAEEDYLTLTFHAISSNSEYAGTYFLSKTVLNGRGVYVNEGSTRFVGFDGARWVIAGINSLPDALEGESFGEFVASPSLREGWEDYNVEVAQELCDSSYDDGNVIKCFNKCNPTGCEVNQECARVLGGKECRDFDECASPSTHTCHEANQECINVVGSFECACSHGFAWNGSACNDGCDGAFAAQFVRASSSTLVNPAGAIDGVKDLSLVAQPEDTVSYANANTCDDVHYLVLDLGSVRSLTETTFWHYFYYETKHYCSQSVDLSVTGAFDGEETRVFSCASFADCGIASAEGRRVHFTATKARFVRVGSSRNDLNIGVHILEVEARAKPCSPSATCAENEPGSYECTCNTGYEGDGVGCDTCAPGYGRADDGETCEDIDECAVESHSCANAMCSNTVGSYTCTCNAGYVDDGAGCNTCAPGYSKLADGVTCDFDECENLSHSCTPDAMCSNTLGSYMCTCIDAGFEWNGTACVDIKECDTSMLATFVHADGTFDHPAGAIDGVNNPPSWRDRGSSANANTCDDVHYLVLDLGSVRSLTETTFWNYFADVRHYCSQSVDLSVTGAFDGEETRVFSCASFADCGIASAEGRRVHFTATKARFVRVGSSRNDLNIGVHILEVEARAKPCSPSATCAENEPGSYECTCNTGYEGDGVGCDTCAPGYGRADDGETCEDIDECAVERRSCDPDAMCSNAVGSYTCTCKDGFDGDGSFCNPHVPAVVQISFHPEYDWRQDPRVMFTFEAVGRWDGIYSLQSNFASGDFEKRNGQPVYGKTVGSHAGFVTTLLVYNGSSWILEFPEGGPSFNIYPTPESVPETIVITDNLAAETFNWPIVKRTLAYDAFVLEAVEGSDDYADCDGLYTQFGNGFVVNGREIWVHAFKERFIGWGGYSWIIASFDFFNQALDEGGLFPGYHFSYADDPRVGWAEYSATGVIGVSYGYYTYRNQHEEEPLQCGHSCDPWTVTQVRVRTKTAVTQLVFDYVEGSSTTDRVGPGEEEAVFRLQEDEVLVRIERRGIAGQCGVAMRFVTNNNRTSPWYGDSTGPQLDDLVTTEQDPIIGVHVDALKGDCPDSEGEMPRLSDAAITQREASGGVCLPCRASFPPPP